jgi:hypothetical protein
MFGSGLGRPPPFEVQGKTVGGRCNGGKTEKKFHVGRSLGSAGPCATIGLLACLAQKASTDDSTHP